MGLAHRTRGNQWHVPLHRPDLAPEAHGETPGTNPSVRLWSVTDNQDNDLTGKLTSEQWEDISQQCFENSNNL